ncbi:hypothetical protein B0O80DRAFT_107589 [Mortierella sp. GBAus27b]|nr:hypothetical protein B0O80DRAFT_107589 [Mortierella sp. GBAus27b]
MEREKEERRRKRRRRQKNCLGNSVHATAMAIAFITWVEEAHMPRGSGEHNQHHNNTCTAHQSRRGDNGTGPLSSLSLSLSPLLFTLSLHRRILTTLTHTYIHRRFSLFFFFYSALPYTPLTFLPLPSHPHILFSPTPSPPSLALFGTQLHSLSHMPSQPMGLVK